MGNIFNLENRFWTFMGHVADLIILNIIFIICCIPIVTIGPSITALYYMTLKIIRGEEVDPIEREKIEVLHKKAAQKFNIPVFKIED